MGNSDEYKKALMNIYSDCNQKIKNSLLADLGLSDRLSDRLSTETVIELQLIVQYIEDFMKELHKDEDNKFHK